MSISNILFSTWLFTASFKSDALWWICDTKTFIFLAHLYVYLHPSMSDILLLFFFFLGSWLFWVFFAVLRLSLVVESGSYSLVMMCRLLIVVTSSAAEHGL